MNERMYIIVTISYLAVGLIVCIYIYMTREGYAEDREGPVEKLGWTLLVAPDLGILVLVFWPVYLLSRICDIVRNAR